MMNITEGMWVGMQIIGYSEANMLALLDYGYRLKH